MTSNHISMKKGGQQFRMYFCQLEANVTFSTNRHKNVSVSDLIKFLASEQLINAQNYESPTCSYNFGPKKNTLKEKL